MPAMKGNTGDDDQEVDCLADGDDPDDGEEETLTLSAN
jgi:hypothetical protein